MRAKTSAGDAVFPVVLAACAVLVAIGLYVCLAESMLDRRVIGAVLLAAGLIGAVITALAYGLYIQLHAARLDAEKSAEQMTALVSERLSAVTVLLNVVTEQQLLSDRAKAVAYREKDRDTLRRAIREETGRGDWEAAKVLVDEMESTFGYRQEAARLRAEIADQRAEGIRRQMQDVHERIDRMCRAEDWQAAQQEASRFIAAYPDFEPARRLPAEIDARRQGYKKQLLDRWNDCVIRHDGDAGIEVLRLLDPYLSPSEAERMAESARSIFNDRKAKLRDQFTAAITARDFATAIRIGDTIQAEFPNAKFAQEVRDSMDALKSRLAEQQPVSV